MPKQPAVRAPEAPEEPPLNTRRFKDYCLLYPTLDPTTKRKLLKIQLWWNASDTLLTAKSGEDFRRKPYDLMMPNAVQFISAATTTLQQEFTTKKKRILDEQHLKSSQLRRREYWTGFTGRL
ncbi:jg1799 [Pararge aegeria aegeria]|uniref:Jg1799 protein n=1 Tax=Pararge aegeria aegeria TaxID=348720 RepID=A0A8S4RSZ9_9NEOP|nr:jg1799 [Pararge aegeria aegeria]